MSETGEQETDVVDGPGGPRPELAITETCIYRGANIWSYEKAIHLVVDLGCLELGQHALARLLQQPLLDVGRQLDREDAEVALHAVELDHGVARGARRLLVRSEQRVLERLDQRVALDSPIAFQLVDELDDLPAHCSLS
jgi:hypothetical protein